MKSRRAQITISRGVTGYILWSLFVFCTTTSFAQAYLCDHSLRYEDYVVMQIDTIEDVFFRTAESLSGRERNLKMDIYLPLDDPIPMRPAILLAHGGGFVSGKKESLQKHCTEMAHRGYVCASVEYRLIDTLVLNEKDYREGAMRAVMDVAYAVQFLRSNARLQNDFDIDPELIFVGGFSAGAVAALHVNFLDPEELDVNLLSDLLRQELEMLLSVGVSYRPAGALSFAGALLDSSWIDRDDPPLMSFHNTGDRVLPCGRGISQRTIYKSPIYGSCFIHEKLNEFPAYVHEPRIFEREGHMNFMGLIPAQSFYKDIGRFAKSIICSRYASLEKTERLIDIDYLPNPEQNRLRLSLSLSDEEPFSLFVLQPDGTVVYEREYLHAQRIYLPLARLENGVYLVHLVGASDQSMGRIMILH